MKPVGHVPGKMKIFVQEIVSEGQKANNSKSDVVFFLPLRYTDLFSRQRRNKEARCP